MNDNAKTKKLKDQKTKKNSLIRNPQFAMSNIFAKILYE